jgi:hypothetical protein
MGKKYLDTKESSLESSILGVWAEAAKKVSETNKNDKSDDGEGLDAVQPKAVKKKFKDRKDKDIDNDGDTDSSDEFLHKKRKAISKAMKDEGNAFGMALKAAKEKGEKTFVVSGKTYEVYEEVVKEGYLELTFRSKQDAEKAYDKINNEIWPSGNPPYDDIAQEGNEIQIDTDGNLNRRNQMLKDLKAGGIKNFKITANESVEESYEFGTNEYRDHALNVTPGETDPEWAQARDFKVASMREALAKVWGLDEKALDKTSKEEYDEEDEELKPVKGEKTMTGGKVAKVDTKPKIDG